MIERPSPARTLARAENTMNPCSAEGMSILAKFIDNIVTTSDSEQDKIRSKEVFEDAKRVVFRGAPEPTYTTPSDKEMFGPMIDFVRNIVKGYPNPDYRRHPAETGGGPNGKEAKEAVVSKNGDGDGDADVEMQDDEQDKKHNQDGRMEARGMVSNKGKQTKEKEIVETSSGGK
jgi:hypothetical protein